MPKIAQTHESKNFSEGQRVDALTNQSSDTLLAELNQLRREKIYYQNQLDIYEKLHDKDRKELKNALL